MTFEIYYCRNLFRRGKDQQMLKQTPRLSNKDISYDDAVDYQKRVGNIRNDIIFPFAG